VVNASPSPEDPAESLRSMFFAWIEGLCKSVALLRPDLGDTGNVKGGGEKASVSIGTAAVVGWFGGYIWSSPLARQLGVDSHKRAILFANFATGFFICILFVGFEVDMDVL
jgi:hypothetical protein